MRHPLRLVMALVAGLLVASLDHGLPHRYVPDDHAVRCALGIARDLGRPELSRLEALVPPAGQYTTYPYLLPYVDLAAIAVKPEWQSRGVGRALLAHVEREALRLVPLERGTAAVRLTVAEDNDRARQVFAEAGFRPVPGEGGTYPAGQRSLSMRKVIPRSRLDSNLPGAKLE